MRFCFWSVICFSFAFLAFANAENQPKKDPILFKADNVEHNNDLDTIVASGHVEISDGKDVVVADKIIYNRKTKQVVATGNVKLYGSQGDILSTEYVELSDDFRDGFIGEVYLLTADNSRFVAEKGIKKDKVSEYESAVYSPCELCQADRLAPPIWQIKATSIRRDEELGDVDYYNARFEFLGAPFFYLPYLGHADPTVERRSGFMPFSFGVSGDYGAMFSLPYYIAISQQKEASLTPFLTTNGGVFLEGTYKQRFSNGMVGIRSGFGYTDNQSQKQANRYRYKKRYYGHLFFETLFNLDEHWRFKANIRKVDHRSYLKKYRFFDPERLSTKPMLMSSAEFEGFYGKDYALIKAYWPQDMRAKPSKNPSFYKQTPFIAPYILHQYVSEPDEEGRYLEVDTNFTMISRQEGMYRDLGIGIPYAKPLAYQRLVLNPIYTWPFVTEDGSAFEIKTSIRGNGYALGGWQREKNGEKWKGSIGRIFPQAGIFWRKPYYKMMGSGRLLMEPMTSVILGPNGVNSDQMPNEDSQDFELDPNNMFSLSRFPGYDLFDSGQRINYGLNGTYFFEEDGSLSLFAGQSYSFTGYKEFPNPKQKGLYKGASDYLVKASFSMSGYTVDVNSMLDRKRLKPKRTRVSFTGGPDYLRTTIGYIYVSDAYFDQVQNTRRHQTYSTVKMALHENWDLLGSLAYSFSKKPGALLYTVGLNYHDDCFGLLFQFQRTYFSDTTIKPGDTYMVTLTFKNLGSYSTAPVGSDMDAAQARFI